MSIENPFGVQVQSDSVPVAIEAQQSRDVAEIQASMIVAKRFPRDERVAMDRILNFCTRPTLAESALYSYAKGGQEISGPSIRLAEAIAQAWGNIRFGFREISRGTDEKGAGFSDIEAFAWDLESNTYKPLVFRVRHWRDTRQGGYALKDERDIYELTANMAQRRVRACILAIIPGDVAEAAEKQCEETLNAKADTSKDGLKKLADAFAGIGITQLQIEKRCQCRLEAVRPAQIVSLRKVFNSIKDGMSKPADWFEPDTSAQDAANAAAEKIAANRTKATPVAGLEGMAP
jgi:hypothetical protein